MIKIMMCGCAHKFQDETHGEHMRVYNRSREMDGKVYHCTVCGNSKTYGASAEEDKKLSKKK